MPKEFCQEAQVEDSTGEMVKLAVERRSKFKESRLLWQSYWNMAVESRSSAGAGEVYIYMYKVGLLMLLLRL